jgi:hypothetical protein
MSESLATDKKHKGMTRRKSSTKKDAEEFEKEKQKDKEVYRITLSLFLML